MIELNKDNVEQVIEKLSLRGGDYSYLRDLVEIQNTIGKNQKQSDDLKAENNKLSKEIGELKRNKQNADDKIKQVNDNKIKISELDITNVTLSSKLMNN